VQRLIRFFLLMALRVMAVLTVVIWGVSQVRVVVANVDCGIGTLSVTTAADGFVFESSAHLRAAAVEFRDVEDMPSWEAMYEFKWQAGPDRKSRFFGGALWLRRNFNAVTIGIKYWLALTVLLLAYATVQFLTRKKLLS